MYNNPSLLIDNEIEKSHKNGIYVLGADKSQMCTAVIWKNAITSSGFNGILVEGD